MGEARKNEVKGVGYVVVYQEGYDIKPLRAFVSPGAATEFRDMVNNTENAGLEDLRTLTTRRKYIITRNLPPWG